MSDLSQTAGNVKEQTGAKVSSVVAGEAVSAGMPVYLHSDGKYYKALNDTAAHAAAAGVAICSAGANQRLWICTEGDINLGATLIVGESYFVSSNAGGVAPYADITNPEYVTCLGQAKSASLLVLNITQTGAQRAA